MGCEIFLYFIYFNTYKFCTLLILIFCFCVFCFISIIEFPFKLLKDFAVKYEDNSRR